MMSNTIIVCGLTEWERKIVKEHKGECEWCIFNETFYNKECMVPFCEKKGRLKEFKNDCEEWQLDTR